MPSIPHQTAMWLWKTTEQGARFRRFDRCIQQAKSRLVRTILGLTRMLGLAHSLLLVMEFRLVLRLVLPLLLRSLLLRAVMGLMGTARGFLGRLTVLEVQILHMANATRTKASCEIQVLYMKVLGVQPLHMAYGSRKMASCGTHMTVLEVQTLHMAFVNDTKASCGIRMKALGVQPLHYGIRTMASCLKCTMAFWEQTLHMAYATRTKTSCLKCTRDEKGSWVPLELIARTWF